MKSCAAAFALIVLAAPALADDYSCEFQWFTRNLIFDRAGYCFASPMGQALFDNADCTGTDIALADRDRTGVAMIVELEDLGQCNIDPSATTLENLGEIEFLRQFDLIPIPTEHESGCGGYLGTAMPLLSHPGLGRMTGQLAPGDNIVFGSQAEDGWDFISVHRGGWHTGDISHGWAFFNGQFPVCQQYAG